LIRYHIQEIFEVCLGDDLNSSDLLSEPIEPAILNQLTNGGSISQGDFEIADSFKFYMKSTDKDIKNLPRKEEDK